MAATPLMKLQGPLEPVGAELPCRSVQRRMGEILGKQRRPWNYQSPALHRLAVGYEARWNRIRDLIGGAPDQLLRGLESPWQRRLSVSLRG